ncbi:hypothetical protein [Salinibacter ruber]|uniref:hypothetical protein n=1 Tax=Salinibacter ruber TaxID=146919 RepID=UPI0020734F9D|nr:hypothetical protein [Salinibacter ruber]
MPDVDEINSNLGALEAQLEELSRLKGLIQTLSEREEAAGKAVQAAERASSSSQEVIEKFEDASTRIEGAEVVERFEEMEDTIRRFEEAGSELEDHVETLPEVVREPLIEHHQQMEEDLSEALSAFRERLDEAGDNLGVLQNALEQRLDRHHSEITDALASAREKQQEHRDQTAETLEEIGTEVGEVDELLQEAQLKNRLEALQDTASSANQAAQNGLSRIDAVERTLSDTLDEHRRRQDRQSEKLEEEVVDLRRQFSEFESFGKWMLWTVVSLEFLMLLVVGGMAYVMIFAG